MSTRDHPPGKDNGSDHTLRELFTQAAPRPAPPEADAEEIRRAVYAEWDAVTGRRVLLRRVGAAAVAAAVVAGVALFVIDTGTGPLPTVATVERVRGNVQIDGVSAALQVGAEVPRGARLATHAGQVALRLANGGSLRLASQTELTLLADAEAELRSGALYFDSDGSAVTSKFAVRTAFGVLRDIGTQFVARLDSSRLEIGVRDGRVALARPSGEVAADEGERISVPQGSGGVRREPIDRFGSDWEWVDRLAPPFDIDGRQLFEFLTWVARETGRTLVFADPGAERVARETVLRGSIDLEPLPKLAAVLTLTDHLSFTLEAERILISTK